MNLGTYIFVKLKVDEHINNKCKISVSSSTQILKIFKLIQLVFLQSYLKRTFVVSLNLLS